jgi:hypothetical protein
MTEEQRIAIIANAVEASKAFQPNEIIEDFIADVKTEKIFGEHGLLNVQESDLEDEISLFDYNESAEEIDEEDQDMGVSDEMKGVYHDS